MKQEKMGNKIMGLLQGVADEVNRLMKESREWQEVVDKGGLFTVVALPENRGAYTVVIHRLHKESEGIVTSDVPSYAAGRIDIDLSEGDPDRVIRCVVGPRASVQYFRVGMAEDGFMSAIGMIR